MSLRTISASAGKALALEEIQGDILIGLHKNVEAFLLFDIIDPRSFKTALIDMLDDIVFSDEVARREQALIDIKGTNAEKPNFIAANILFSRPGIAKLTDVGGVDFGVAFSRSVAERRTFLKDPAAASLPAFEEDADGVVLLAAADEPKLRHEIARWQAALGDSIAERHLEIGRVRPGSDKGREHFGYMDGVSQPGIAGLTPPQQHPPGSPPGDAEQGLPGQDLIKPGVFVFGYDDQDGKRAEPPLDWMCNGAFMVLRRLEQRVALFESFLEAAAGKQGADRLGSRLVGRWKSGAPIMIATERDDPDLAKDVYRNNDFQFLADDHQEKCPFLGHIRKTYPRDDLDFPTGFPKRGDGEAFAERHRIIRAGIPFGYERGEDPDVGPDERIGHEASRGLMFVSYQSSIEEGFEFIQDQWCNNPDFVFEKTAKVGGPVIAPGIDLIIGQTVGGMRFGDMSTPNVDDILRDVPPFVIPTGTTYFFAPSRSALRDVLTV